MGKRKRRKATSFSPEVTLRPRLDNLWADRVLLHKDDEAIEGDLDVIARDVAPDFLVKTMVRAYVAASAATRARLDGVLPRWLARRELLSVAQEMAADGSLEEDLWAAASAWLKAAGVDTASLERLPSLFFQAYYYDDAAALGEKSQAYVTVLWYTSPRKHRAQGMGFLLDYNPPWDGAVKDVLVTRRRRPKRLLGELLDTWSRGDMELEQISAEQAKTLILTALSRNRAAELRLPRDLIAGREFLVRHVLSLPDGPDTPAFTGDDLDFLARHGQRPEEVMRFEQTIGRRVRTEDGGEIVVMGGPDWDDEEW